MVEAVQVSPRCYRCGTAAEKGRKSCKDCRIRYRNWSTLSLEERAARFRTTHPKGVAGPSPRVRFVLKSNNKKTGQIPVSTTSAETCPTTCGLYAKGCYAEYGHTKWHWVAVPEEGGTWTSFLKKVEALPREQFWRHNEAGDLPGRDQAINATLFLALVHRARHTRGFTFTHKTVLGESDVAYENRALVRRANLDVRFRKGLGLTVNLSADSLELADKLSDLDVGPVVVVLPQDAPERLRTPQGRHVVVCLAEQAHLRGEMTCDTCRLCGNVERKSIVGFRAHGQAKALVSEIVRAKR